MGATAALSVPEFGAVGAIYALIAGIFVSGSVTQNRSEKPIGRFGLAHNVLPVVLAAAIAIALAISAEPFCRTLDGSAVFIVCDAFMALRLKSDLIHVAHSNGGT
ncbi:MAG: hypothetical protein HKO04_11750 [Silicimonas sp.]|nr:hypothetical protein [Silicimonas sp.]